MAFELPYVVQADDDDPLINTVTVVATDPQDHAREAAPSGTSRSTTPTSTSRRRRTSRARAIGETVTYSINVSNPIEDTPMYVEVLDPMFGGIDLRGLDLAVDSYWNESFDAHRHGG